MGKLEVLHIPLIYKLMRKRHKITSRDVGPLFTWTALRHAVRSHVPPSYFLLRARSDRRRSDPQPLLYYLCIFYTYLSSITLFPPYLLCSAYITMVSITQACSTSIPFCYNEINKYSASRCRKPFRHEQILVRRMQS